MICYVEIYVFFIYLFYIYLSLSIFYIGSFQVPPEKNKPHLAQMALDFQMLKIFQHFLDEEKILFQFKSVFPKNYLNFI